MNRTFSLLTILAVGALATGRGFASEAAIQPSEQRLHSKAPIREHAGGPAHGDGNLGNPKEPKRVPLRAPGGVSEKNAGPGPLHLQAKRPPMNEPHPIGLNKPAAFAKAGPTINKTASQREELARMEPGGETGVQSRRVVRGAGATASLGGPTVSGSSYRVGGLNGTGIKRRP